MSSNSCDPRPDIDSVLGICMKDSGGVVISQNSICEKICGNRKGQICKDGCMKTFNPEDKTNFTPIKTMYNVHEGDNACDAVYLNTNKNLITLLYPKSENIKIEEELFNKIGLTKSEQSILFMLLDQFTNKQIADKLFISTATVKTHINNLYKKLPEDIRLKISNIRK